MPTAHRQPEKDNIMIYLKNLIYYIVLFTTLPLLFFCSVLASPFPKGVNRVGKAWTALLLWVLEHVVGLRYEVHGKENIPDTPSIICSKHQSAWETFALQQIFPLQTYVLKKELFRIPFFGWALKLGGGIGIDRKAGADAMRQLAEQGLKRKQQGFWIVIFPEGTRVPAGERRRYKLGGARMAKLFEMDIVPVALNSGEFWAKNAVLKKPGVVQVVIGKPISYQATDSEVELMQLCEDWIEARQVEISHTPPKAA